MALNLPVGRQPLADELGVGRQPVADKEEAHAHAIFLEAIVAWTITPPGASHAAEAPHGLPPYKDAPRVRHRTGSFLLPVRHFEQSC